MHLLETPSHEFLQKVRGWVYPATEGSNHSKNNLVAIVSQGKN